MRYLRVEVKKAKNMSEDEALRAVDMEDREAAVAAKEAAQQEAENAQSASKARIKADLVDFAKAFPEVYQQAKVNPKAIPKEVWDEVNRNGMTLTAAYSRYAVNEAKREAAAADARADASSHNQKNSDRSTGSMKSAGNDSKIKDDFLTGLNTRG